ncbi:MAG: methyltransferase [Pseudonocardiaceae bacterium]
MSTTSTVEAREFSPLRTLQRLNPYHWSVGLVMRGMAQLLIADHLVAGPRTAAELAAAIDAHPPSLARFLRACVLHGLVTPAEGDRFALTEDGHLLRSDVPSLRGFIIAVNSPGMTRPWELIADVVRTGQPATEAAWGTDHWSYYAANPEEGRCYAETFIALSVEVAAALHASYDLTQIGSIVDVGGAPGATLVELLDRNPGCRAVLLDLPWAIPYTRELVADRGLAHRVRIEEGDFFEQVPAGGDLYLLKNILCDLPDERAAQVLGRCAQAGASGSTLLLVDWENVPSTSHVHATDVEFMVLTGGRARTEAEYLQLLAQAGYAKTRRLPLVGHERAPFVLIEATHA